MAMTRTECLMLISLAIASAAHYLRDPSLRRLRVGSTKPTLWLGRQLQLQGNGLSGQLPYFWPYFNDSAWLGGRGTQPHQFIPYYLNGLVPLSYQIQDDNLVAIRERYLEYIFQLQANQTSGWLGPEIPRDASPTEARNYWSKYLAIEAFEAYAEAEPSRADAVIRSLIAHHRQFWDQLSSNQPALNQSRWGVARHEDGLLGILWLLDPTLGGQGSTPDTSFLWDLLVTLHNSSDQIMSDVSDPASRYTWEEWFNSGDPFAPHDDSESTGTAHLLRHGVGESLYSLMLMLPLTLTQLGQISERR